MRRIVIIIVCVGLAAGIFVLFRNSRASRTADLAVTPGSAMSDINQVKTNMAYGLAISVTPVISAFSPAQFTVALDTSGKNLDFDLLSSVALYDDAGGAYRAARWTGGRGGEHIAGTLIFPPLNPRAKKIRLKFFNLFGLGERVFDWTL